MNGDNLLKKGYERIQPMTGGVWKKTTHDRKVIEVENTCQRMYGRRQPMSKNRMEGDNSFQRRIWKERTQVKEVYGNREPMSKKGMEGENPGQIRVWKERTQVREGY